MNAFWKRGGVFFLAVWLIVLSLSGCRHTADTPSADTGPAATTLSAAPSPTTLADEATTTTATTTTTTTTTVDLAHTTFGYPEAGTAKTVGALPTNPDTGLPQHVPGTIGLTHYLLHMWDYNRPYRWDYYDINLHFSDAAQRVGVVQWSVCEEWIRNVCYKEYPFGTPDPPMIYVEFIRKFQVTRDQFDQIVDSYIADLTELKLDMTNELLEVPNADILYTFDYAIINEYYRYE